MSGLAGVIYKAHSKNQLENLINEMGTSLAHRGHQHSEQILADHAAFMVRQHDKGVYSADIHHENELVVIVDGNIHNALEIATQYNFTEINTISKLVFRLYQKLGIAMLNVLEGAYAIIIYNTSSKEIMLCRDMFANRPLYYASQNGNFWFASEIKAILADANFNRSVNRKILPQQLTYGYTIGPDTLFSNIYKVTPGYYFIGNIESKLQCKLFINPDIPKKNPASADYYGDKIWSLLGKSFKQQLRGRNTDQIRTGLFLSGGIDSSLVALKQYELGMKNQIAIGCGYSDKSFSNCDETAIAEGNAKRCAMDYRNIPTGSSDDLLTTLKNVIYEMDEPVRYFISLPIERSLKELEGEFDCLTTGIYADVLFGAGSQYDCPIYKLRKILPEPLLIFIRSILPALRKIPKIKGYAAWFKRGDVNSMREYILKSRKSNGSLRGLLKELDINTCARHLDQFKEVAKNLSPEDEWTLIYMILFGLSWDDLFESIASHKGLDVIHPFKTIEMYKLSLEMPYKGKISRYFTKPYMRALAAKKYSHGFAYTEKQIFSSPESVWLSDSPQLKEFIISLKNTDTHIHQYLNSDAIISLIEDYEKHLNKKQIDHATCQLIFTLAGLEIWLNTFFNK